MLPVQYCWKMPHQSAVTIWTVLRDVTVKMPVYLDLFLAHQNKRERGRKGWKPAVWGEYFGLRQTRFTDRRQMKRGWNPIRRPDLVCLCISTLPLKHIWSLSPSLIQSPSHWMKGICSDLNQLKRHNAASASKRVGSTVFVFVWGREIKKDRKKEWWRI